MFRKLYNIIILLLVVLWLYYAYKFTNFFKPNIVAPQTWVSKDAIQNKLEKLGRIEVVHAYYSISQKASAQFSQYIKWDDDLSSMLKQVEQRLQKDDIYIDATWSVIAWYDFLSGNWTVQTSGNIIIIDANPQILFTKVDTVQVVQRDMWLVPRIFWQDLWLEEIARSQAIKEIEKKAIEDKILDKVDQLGSETLLKIFEPLGVEEVSLR